MRRTQVNFLFALASLVGLAVGSRLAFAPLPPMVVMRRGEGTPVAVPSLAAERNASAQVVVTRDPFRLSRRPSSVVYDAMPGARLTPAPLLRPTLVLRGLVWNRARDPTALVDGLPGIEGPRVVRLGERVAGLHVTAITSNGVVIAGPDTTWLLTVREPWR